MTRVGLVLGAGGVVGHAFHAGVLSAIEEATGWDPRRADVIVGTSAGSLVAATMRAGMSAADLANRERRRPLSAEGERLERRVATARPPGAASPLAASEASLMSSPARIVRALREPWRVRPGSLAAALLPAGRVPTERVGAPMRDLHGDTWPSDPMWIVAVDLDRGRRVVFGRRGEPAATVADAVAASCAIPGYFRPVTIDGVRYIDGGAHTPSNADELAGERLDLVIVSSPMSTGLGAVRIGVDLPFRGAAGLALTAEVAALRRRGMAVLTFQPGVADQRVMAGNALDPAKAAPVCAQVLASTAERLRQPGVRALLRPLERA